MQKKYLVEINTIEAGPYEAESKEEVKELYAKDAGYNSWDEMLDVSPIGENDHFLIKEV